MRLDSNSAVDDEQSDSARSERLGYHVGVYAS
jgi:hypothetical protein